jgi:Tfp pilus assembly protein PilN
MINLLPVEQKEELLEERNLKMVLILGIVALGFLVCLFLFLFAIKISISSKLDVQKISVDQREEELKNSQNQKLETEINNYNQVLMQLESFYKNNFNLSDNLEKISTVLPEGVYLKSLNFNLENKKISISGFSPTREKLLELKGNLEKTNDFKNINFPPSSWIEAVNVNFTADFKIN